MEVSDCVDVPWAVRPVVCDSTKLCTIDSRRGVFHIGDSTYSSKLVDLPCIVESQKTLDNKNLFKVADICQVYSASSCSIFLTN